MSENKWGKFLIMVDDLFANIDYISLVNLFHLQLSLDEWINKPR